MDSKDEAVHTLLTAEQMRLEPERLACEARYVASLDPRQRASYLHGVGTLRGLDASELLRAAVANV